MAGTPFEALLACHAVTRHLARGRDVRALGRSLDTAERCEVGRAIAAFPSELSRDGDPLGDTYHYWANLIAGVSAAHFGGVRGAVTEQLFDAGPMLMTTIRGGLFGRTLFYGDHAAIDRLGLSHGLALGRASLRRSAYTAAQHS